MAKRDTRQLIADAFVGAVRETSLSRVRIADLIDELGINRNTYYYHFSSKLETALWVFRCALDEKLRGAPGRAAHRPAVQQAHPPGPRAVLARGDRRAHARREQVHPGAA